MEEISCMLTLAKNNMADIIDGFSLEKPASFADDCSNICVEIFGDNKIIVGNENGCFLSTLEGACKGLIQELKPFQGKEVPALCSMKNEEDNPHVFYVGSENSVYKFDQRCSLNKQVVSFSENTDDINQIVINDSGLLASCDDSGECKIFDTKQNKVYRTLRNRHKNICSTVSFIPNRSDDVVTGGLDSQILTWNYTSVRLVQTLNTQEVLEKLGDDSVKMFNPPLVNSIEISGDGKLCAAGLGNGTLQLFHVLKGKNVLAPSHVLNRHSTIGVSNVHFVKQSETNYLLASGGNDCEVNVWEIPIVATPGEKKNKQFIPTNIVVDETEMEVMIKHKIRLDSKINYLCSFVKGNKTILFCADQTSNIKCYVIPEVT